MTKLSIGIAVVAILLSGCGSDSKNSSASENPTTTSIIENTPNATTNTTAKPGGSTTTSTASKTLANGEYVGTFSGVETELKLANFTAECPTPGTFLVNLTQASFEVESNPANPAAGHVDTVSFEEWVPRAATGRWVVEQTAAAVRVRSESAPTDHVVC